MGNEVFHGLKNRGDDKCPHRAIRVVFGFFRCLADSLPDSWPRHPSVGLLVYKRNQRNLGVDLCREAG